MINYGKVRSSNTPQEVEFTSDYVFIASNVVPYETTVDGQLLIGYEYDYVAYTKDEYIQLVLTENAKIISDLEDELQAAKILLGVE